MAHIPDTPTSDSAMMPSRSATEMHSADLIENSPIPTDTPPVLTATPEPTLPLFKTITNKLKLLLGGSLLLVSLLGLMFGYKVGYYQGEGNAREQAKQALGGEELTSEDIKAMRSQLDLLKGQLSTAQQERDISLSNLADLRTTNEQLKTVNLQFQQNDDIFTKLLAKEGGIPLQIIGAKIEPLPENAFEYRVDVAMLDKSNQVKRLIPKLTLLDSTHMVEVPLEPNAYDIHGIARIRGRFLMPQGFTPKQAKVELTAGNEKIEQAYDWQLGQPVNNMPYSLAETPNADQRPLATDPETQSTTPPSLTNGSKKSTSATKTNSDTPALKPNGAKVTTASQAEKFPVITAGRDNN